MELMLYHSAAGANSLSALIYMEEKRIRYAARPVDGRLPDLRAAGALPLLANEDVYVAGSTRISRYVEKLIPDSRVQPADTEGRRRMHQWLERIDAELVPLLDTAGCMLLAERFRGNRWADAAAGTPAPATLSETLAPCFRDIEEALSRSAWLAGESFSLADIHAFPLIARFAGLLPGDVDRRTLPRTVKWLEVISDRPSVHKVVSFLEGRMAMPATARLH